jgi:hypothetical protein
MLHFGPGRGTAKICDLGNYFARFFGREKLQAPQLLFFGVSHF